MFSVDDLCCNYHKNFVAIDNFSELKLPYKSLDKYVCIVKNIVIEITQTFSPDVAKSYGPGEESLENGNTFGKRNRRNTQQVLSKLIKWILWM